MTRGKVFLLMLTVAALLCAAGALTPPAGFTLCSDVTVRFPTPQDLVDELFPPDEPEGPSPEEILAMRRSELLSAQRDSFMVYLRESPARIQFPHDSFALFDSFFAGLDSARLHPVRVLYYGDSQIEEDRITSTLRTGLQQRFGGSGPGLLPLGRNYFTLRSGQTSTVQLARFAVYGEGGRRSGGAYGVMGQLFRLDTSMVAWLSSSKGKGQPASPFSRLSLFAGNLSSLKIRTKGKSGILSGIYGNDMGRICLNLPDSTVSLSLYLGGNADIYGVCLDDSVGVSVDNVPMRGSSGTVFTRMSGRQISEYAAWGNVRLIVLQYGINIIPYASRKVISDYKAAMAAQISRLRTLVPGAAILLVGPSDMSNMIAGRMQTYPLLPALVDSLRDAALESGAAFWDLYSAMGGENSMASWTAATPPLAGSDYTHFTRLGASEVGDMLLRNLMVCYDYYLWRQNDTASLSLQPASL